MEKVELSELKSGERGVAIGEENLFLSYEKQPGKWKFKLLQHEPGRLVALTAWISVKDVEDLRASLKAKLIRESIRLAYQEQESAIMESIISCLQPLEDVQENEEEDDAIIIIPSEYKQEVEKEVERTLDSEDPLEEVSKHLDNVIAGERDNKKTIFILLLSGKSKDPRDKQMILLKATEGAGKSTLMKISDFLKTKKVGRFSEHALDYSNLEKYEVLNIKEIGLMDDEKQGTSTVKFLSADDQGYSIEITVKDKDSGRFTTMERRIPPMTVISSTTRILLNAQYIRRTWIFSPDESEEQTKKVKEFKAEWERQRNLVTLGLLKYTSYEWSCWVLKKLVDSIESVKVVVPFPKTLFDVLGTSILRLRGDYDKLMALVRFYCILLQKKLPENERVVFATPQTAVDILKVAQRPLATMLSNLEERVGRLIEALKDLEMTKCQESIGKFERERIAVHMGKSEDTIKKYLNGWEAAGYASSDHKKPKTFTLLYPLKEIEEKIGGISGILESPDVLMGSMAKEAQTFFNSISGIALGGDSVGLNDILRYYLPKTTTISPPEPASDIKLGKIQGDLTPKGLEGQAKLKSPIPRGFPESEKGLIPGASPKIAEKTEKTVFNLSGIESEPYQLTGELYHHGACASCNQRTQISCYVPDRKGQRYELCSKCAHEISIVVKLKREWTGDATEEEVLDRLMKIGLPSMEARQFFDDILAGKLLFWRDNGERTVWRMEMGDSK